MNEQNLSRLHRQYLEPTDEFFCEDWQGGEIYKDEEYLVMEHNGDKVLFEKDNVMEYVEEHYEFLLELLDDVSIRKVAGK